VFVNGEKTLSIATKNVFAGLKPVPEAATAVFEEFAVNCDGVTMKAAATVKDLEAEVKAVSFAVAVTRFAPPGDVGTLNDVVN
jgi:predicted nucleotide-binding protein